MQKLNEIVRLQIVLKSKTFILYRSSNDSWMDLVWKKSDLPNVRFIATI